MFPKDFLWGAATSSHQVEGNNTNNDWWAWEQAGRVRESSGQAARHFELFEKDFELVQQLHHNAHRFSIEWSRLEPREGEFDPQALAHYRAVIQSLRNKSIEPVVTLNHFTLPQWLAREGGWFHKRSVPLFTRYVEYVVDTLGRDVRYWITINEPVVLAYFGYWQGLWPPGEKALRRMWQVMQILVRAHKAAYAAIHGIYPQHGWLSPEVGIAKSVRPFHACPQTNNVFCRAHAGLRHWLFNHYFLERTESFLDFIGINYYEQEFISNARGLGHGLFGGNCNQAHRHAKHFNVLHWGHFPEGILEALRWVAGFQKPILITENGTCERRDELRGQYIKEHLVQVQKAVTEGVPVIGYLYWSLLDNFEWHEGFGPRFGLIEVDYKTFQRHVRRSAQDFGGICRTNQI